MAKSKPKQEKTKAAPANPSSEILESHIAGLRYALNQVAFLLGRTEKAAEEITWREDDSMEEGAAITAYAKHGHDRVDDAFHWVREIEEALGLREKQEPAATVAPA